MLQLPRMGWRLLACQNGASPDCIIVVVVVVVVVCLFLFVCFLLFGCLVGLLVCVFVVCCLLFVVCCMLYAVCCLLFAVRCCCFCHGLTSTQCVRSHHATMRCNPDTETNLHVPGHPGVETPNDPGTPRPSMTHSCESSRTHAKEYRTRHASDHVHDFLRDLWHQATILHHEGVHPELNHSAIPL